MFEPEDRTKIDRPFGQATVNTLIPDEMVPLTLVEKWQTIVDLMAELCQVPAGLVMRISGDHIQVLVASKTEGNPYHPGGSEHLEGSGLYCETVIGNDCELLVGNALKDPVWDHNPDLRFNMISYLGFPIRWPDRRPFGTICILDNKENVYSETYKRLIAQFRDTIENQLETVYDEIRHERTLANTRYDHLLSLLPHLVYESYIDHSNGSRAILYVNKKGAEVFELDPDSPDLASDFRALVHPDDREWVHRRIGAQAHTPSPSYHSQYRLLLPRGGLRWVDSRGESEQLENGDALLRGVLTDITPLKEAEQALSLERERLAMATAASRQGVWDLDTLTGRAYCDRRWCQIMGIDEATPSVSHQEWVERVHPEDVDRFEQQTREALTAQSDLQHTFRIVTPNGEIRWVQSLARTVEALDGKSLHLVGVIADVTESRAYEENLRQSHEAHQRAEKLARIGSWSREIDKDQAVWSDTLYDMFQLDTSVPAPRFDGMRQILTPESFGVLSAAAERCVSSGEPYNIELECIRTTGEHFFANARGQPSHDAAGAIIGAFGTIHDITAQRQAALALQEAKEAAEAAERVKSEFLAMMSHEIRTPMNTVIGMAQLTLKTELTHKQRNYLDKIDHSAKALLSIINDVLDFSKIEAGKLELEVTEFSLEAVLDSVATVTALQAEEKGLEIAYEVMPAVPDRVIGDPLRLGQVLINLVSNAVKFTEQGEVVVSIDLASDIETGPPTLRFTVRDTGIGLDAGQIENVFEAFEQGGSNISRQYGGTGLGLAICKRLVARMGGQISVISEPGKGSTFSFTIKTQLPIGNLSPLPLDLPGLVGRRVLIVDDNASAREILSRMVMHFGMDTHVANNGSAALAILRQASLRRVPFELVLMDWRMPGMDGLTAAELIKADASLHHTPAVLMVTAYARTEIMLRVEQLGLAGILIKPVTESMMFNTIANIFGCAPPRDPLVNGASDPAAARLQGRRVLLAEDAERGPSELNRLLREMGLVVGVAVSTSDLILQSQHGLYDMVVLDDQAPQFEVQAIARRLREEEQFKLPILVSTEAALIVGRSPDPNVSAYIGAPVDRMQLREALLRCLPNEPRLSALAGRRVLVVDDNALNREVATDFLLAAGIKVDTAVSGPDALRRLEVEEYDAILMDIHMPGMSGLEATRKIREQPRWARLPIIALTAQAQADDYGATLAAGMNDHLTKPIDEARLYDTLLRSFSVTVAQRLDTASIIGDRPRVASGAMEAGFPASTPEMDLSAALARLGGDRDRLFRLLRGFLRDFRNAPAQLRNDYAAGRYEAIEAISHTLNGTARYLGANRLAQEAQHLEEAARHRNAKQTALLLPALTDHFQCVLESVGAILAQAEAGHSSAPRFDRRRAKQLIEQAEPLIAKGDYAALKLLDQLAAMLAKTSLADLAEKARILFEDVELVAASETMRVLGSSIDDVLPESSHGE